MIPEGFLRAMFSILYGLNVMKFGLFEIGLILLLLIFLFGGWRTGRILGKTYGTYRKVDDTRNQLQRKFSLSNLLRLENHNKKDE